MPNAKAILARLSCSKFFWLAAFIVVLNFFFQWFDPLDIMGADKEAYHLTQGAVKFKSKSLRALPQAPDVALIGSSLPMAAAYYSDCIYYKPAVNEFIDRCRPRKISAFQAYPGARYLEQKLSTACGKPVTVFNLTSAACMPSDAYLLLSRAIEDQPNIKAVIYGVAPRDFMDNLVPDVGLTPAFEVLSQPSSLPSTISTETPLPVAFEIAMSSLCSFYRQRTNLRELATSVPTQVFDREATLAKVVQRYGNNDGASGDTRPRPPQPVGRGLPSRANGPQSGAQALAEPMVWSKQLQDHYKDYGKRYNPPNDRRFRLEMAQFENILRLCKNHGIQLFVVNMPITERNREMIGKNMYLRFQNSVATLPAQYGATYFNLDDSSYDPKKDYMDSVHLNEVGGPKLIDTLARHLSSQLICTRR